jgi:YVTN family beta-propeller protein
MPRWVAITPDGRSAYVTVDDFNPDGSSLSAVIVIDTATNKVATTITLSPGGGGPSGVAISPDGRRAYVPNFDSSRLSGVVSVIDTAKKSVTTTITISGRGGGPAGVAITPDGRELFVATDKEVDENNGRVSVIDTTTNIVITKISVNPFPSGIAITPNGRHAYVLDTEQMPAVIDTATHERTFPNEGLGSGKMVFTPDGHRAYVPGDSSVLVNVIEIPTNTLINVIDLGPISFIPDVAITPDGRHVYVTQRGIGPNVRVIDTTTNKLVDFPVDWSGTADGLAITPTGLHAYVADRQSKAVVVIPTLDS